MSTVSFRASENEYKILNSYVKYHKKSLSEVIRDVMLSHIELEYDLKVFEDYEKRKKDGKLNLIEISKVWKDMEI